MGGGGDQAWVGAGHEVEGGLAGWGYQGPGRGAKVLADCVIFHRCKIKCCENTIVLTRIHGRVGRGIGGLYRFFIVVN